MNHRRRKAKKGRKAKKRYLSPQEALVKALNHPVRAKALAILSERTAGPKELAEIIDVPISNVSYHVRVLDDLGLIEIVEEELVRGSVAHFYRPVERTLIDQAQWEQLDPKVRSAVSGQLVEALVSDAAASLAAGYFDKRADRHASRTPLLLDEKGWQAVGAIQVRALDQILMEQSAAAERIKDSGEAIQAVFGMFCFEMPPDAKL